MTTCLLITKDDIKTTPMGRNIVITTVDGTQLNFSLEAAKELLIDFQHTIQFIESGNPINEWPTIKSKKRFPYEQ